MVTDQNLVLGLDIGSESVGWALLAKDCHGFPCRIVKTGVRIFQAGVEGDISSGQTTSRAAERRAKRMLRRQIERRSRRKRNLFRLLQRNGLLPPGDDIGTIVRTVDADVVKQPFPEFPDWLEKEKLPHIVPYYLRSCALDRLLPDHYFGRALYHLAQRRGFLSNRKTPEDNEEGVVKEAISELRNAMVENGSRTLGEHLAKVDVPAARVRGWWTARDMFVEEFEKIWQRQTELGNDKLTPELRDEVYHTIFFQRKLKLQDSLVGRCELEPSRKRCPWYRPEAQRFRLLQTVNNLRVTAPGTAPRELDAVEWEQLTGALDDVPEMTMAKARELLAFPRGTCFSIEEGGEKKLPGNRTRAAFLRVFGGRWDELPEREREQAVQDVHSYEETDALRKRGRHHWELDGDSLDEFCKIRLAPDYCNLSLNAIAKLLPHLEEGRSYAEAVKIVYGEINKQPPPAASLPAIYQWDTDIRNPAVARCLTEVRHVVNTVIRDFGLPDEIHIELARDLKNSKKQKTQIIVRNRENERMRARAKQTILDECGIQDPSQDDILKVLLMEECSRTCPYTQRQITPRNLLSPESSFDVEHIIPLSRSLDDSFMNKTLCYHEENRNRKRNRTPYEAYAGTEQYDDMLNAVRRFHGPHAAEKLRRFSLEKLDEFEEFASRKLNDTRYASCLAAKYAGLLFGGDIDSSGRRRVFTLAGGVTWYMRAVYGMNFILGDGEKSRDDHRHHAVDAVAIAMAGPKTIKQVADFVKQQEQSQFFSRFRVREPLSPFEGFHEKLTASIMSIVPSHHRSRKLRGALHKETIYRRDTETTVRVRKPLEKLSAGDVPKIVDPVIRKLVIEKLTGLDESKPDIAFKTRENLPVFNGHPIRSVTFMHGQKTVTVGDGNRQRAVVSGNNHHIEIVAALTPDGTIRKWEGTVVSLMEAMARSKKGSPVVCRDHGPNRRFLFSLMAGDIIQCEFAEGKPELFVVRALDAEGKRVEFSRATDARLKKEIRDFGEWYRKAAEPLRNVNCRKVVVTPLGEVREAND